MTLAVYTVLVSPAGRDQIAGRLNDVGANLSNGDPYICGCLSVEAATAVIGTKGMSEISKAAKAERIMLVQQ